LLVIPAHARARAQTHTHIIIIRQGPFDQLISLHLYLTVLIRSLDRSLLLLLLHLLLPRFPSTPPLPPPPLPPPSLLTTDRFRLLRPCIQGALRSASALSRRSRALRMRQDAGLASLLLTRRRPGRAPEKVRKKSLTELMWALTFAFPSSRSSTHFVCPPLAAKCSA